VTFYYGSLFHFCNLYIIKIDFFNVSSFIKYENNLKMVIAMNPEENALIVINNYIKSIELIIDEGFLDEQDNNGQTALHLAAECGNDIFIDIVLKKGGNPNLKDNNGQTPLHISASKGDLNCIKSLLNGGADPSLTDNNGSTPLHLALIGRDKDDTNDEK
jgi:ankyrin repeat protein